MGIPKVFWMVLISASGPPANAELILFCVDSPVLAGTPDRVT